MYFVDRLKEQNVSVLYVAGFGEAPKSDEDLELEALEERPYWQEPAQLRVAARDQHVINVSEYAALLDAGVSCALVPGNSTSSWKDAWEQLADAGMSPDEIWAAASADVAELLQLEHVGNVAAGSAADFVIYSGEVDAEAKPLWVFADGRGWEYTYEDEAGDEEGGEGESSGAEGGNPKLDGAWRITVQAPTGEQEFFAIVDTASNSVGMSDSPDRRDRPGYCRWLRRRSHQVHLLRRRDADGVHLVWQGDGR